MKKTIILLSFLLIIPLSLATPTALPIINRNQFQSCIFGYCQTVAPEFLFTDIALSGDNTSWNETYADSKYALIGVGADNTSWNESYANTLYYPLSNPFNFINSSFNSSYDAKADYNFGDNNFNGSGNFITSGNISIGGNLTVSSGHYIKGWYITTTTIDIFHAYIDRIDLNNNITSLYGYFIGNGSLLTDTYNKSWNESYYRSIWNATNTSYALATEPLWSANYSDFNTSWSSTFNSTYDLKFNTTATTNLNMSIYNTSYNVQSASIPTCSKYYNSTGNLIWCDCYNNTHKWMANTC